jgi:hypothetical protein
MEHEITIKTILDDQLDWPTGDSSYPEFGFLDNRHTVKLDPFPGYCHNHLTAKATIIDCVKAFPPQTNLTTWLSRWDDLSRYNGFLYRDSFKYNENNEPLTYHTHIFLTGKKTPIHPVSTRALIAHEYGHAVAYWLELKTQRPVEQIYDEYVDVVLGNNCTNDRELEHAGRILPWHRRIQEIFADDFRVFLAGIDTDFYPHYNIYMDNDMIERRKYWWKEQLQIIQSAPITRPQFQQLDLFH